MDAEMIKKAKDIFQSAVDLPESQREAFLSNHCADDADLRAVVQRLLSIDAEGIGEFMCTPVFTPTTGGVGDTGTGLPERIGRYQIVRVLGEGGMGVVYEARQDKPQRTVALKVIRTWLPTANILHRFQHEAETLGQLQHPGIACIYEAGMAEFGGETGTLGHHPYFAMELVRGRPLSEYASEMELTMRDRLKLIANVCDAVQHAHQRGVIHRDLKPANILVDEAGQPKVLDFGVARATDADVQTMTMQTDTGQLIGTVPYMSPEQVTGDSRLLDTRSDVYALGVILYELLSGKLPLDVRNRSIPEAARIIREEKPSRLGSVTRTASGLRGDVETIVVKALEKDKSRRYSSAAEFAGDIRRYLAHQPILARPPSALYQLRTFARRNQALVTSVVVTFVALCAALVNVTLERDRALRSERIAQAVNDFLNEDLLAAAGPLRTPNRDITMREVLDAASDKIAGRFDGQPETKASIHATLGKTYEYLGEYEAAEPHLEEAVRLYRRTLGDKHLNTLNAMEDLALVYRRHARYDEAEELFTEALAGKRDLLGNDHFETAVSTNDLATLYHTVGRHEEAERLYLESVEVRRALFGDEHAEMAACECNLANLYEVQGRYDEAAALHEMALKTRRSTLGDEHPDTLMSMNSLAKVYNSRKEYGRAEPLSREVLAVRRRTLGEQHPDTLKTMNNLAVLCRNSDQYEEAERLFIGVLAGQRKLLGEDHPHTLVSTNNLADLYQQMGRYEEAVTLFDVAIKGARKSLPADHWYTGVFLTKYGRCLTSLGRFSDAQSALCEAHQVLSTSLGADHDRTEAAITAMISLYDRWGKPGKAAEHRAMLGATN